jgi:hypothetical protein
MRNHSVLDWLIRTGATVLAITILSALGAAVFALFCGALGWVFGVERVRIGFLWATTSGAIAGLLMGTLWAIDRIMNWRYYLSPSRDDSRDSTVSSEDGKALEETALDKLTKKAGADEGAATG